MNQAEVDQLLEDNLKPKHLNFNLPLDANQEMEAVEKETSPFKDRSRADQPEKGLSALKNLQLSDRKAARISRRRK